MGSDATLAALRAAHERRQEVVPLGCIAPGCGRCRYRKGLCSTHYSRATLDVRRGKTTWAALEQAGLALPARRSNWG